jgi:hypothetical protein
MQNAVPILRSEPHFRLSITSHPIDPDARQISESSSILHLRKGSGILRLQDPLADLSGETALTAGDETFPIREGKLVPLGWSIFLHTSPRQKLK